MGPIYKAYGTDYKQNKPYLTSIVQMCPNVWFTLVHMDRTQNQLCLGGPKAECTIKITTRVVYLTLNLLVKSEAATLYHSCSLVLVFSLKVIGKFYSETKGTTDW